MNWFDDLFGSLENPQFRYHYEKHWFAVGPENPAVDRNEDGWTGWLCSRTNTTTGVSYCHGTIRMPNDKPMSIIIPKPMKANFPTTISITKTSHAIGYRAFFNIPERPHACKVATDYDGNIKSIMHTFSGANGIFNMVNRNNLDNNTFNVLDTNYIEDDMLRMELMSVMALKNDKRIKEIYKEAGYELV